MDNNKAKVSAIEIPIEQCKHILIVEDETIFANAVKKQLTRAGYQCKIAMNLHNARKNFLLQKPDLVLLDIRLPDGSGLDFLKSINAEKDSPPFLVMSAYGEIEDAVSAMKIGATDYFKKPIDLQELLLHVEKVLAKQALEKKLNYSKTREHHATQTVEFIGTCSSILLIKEQIKKIANLHLTPPLPSILILGETGTGKDVVARSLHAHSENRDKPFVQIDCASLPRDIIEAELFGHEKGAFTNAHVARTGLIEAAEAGTVFMDEIGELPLDLQSKLLAVLERRVMRRIGATKEIVIPAWFIAATNRQLSDLVEEGKFRADLYYRLNVVSIEMPPLREREDDIILLAKYFAKQVMRRYNFSQVNFSDSALTAIMQYPWAGNVREMKHVIERAILLNGEGIISAEGLNLTNTTVADKNATKAQEPPTAPETDEYSLIQQALEKTKGNISMAARELGISRMALRYRIKKYNIPL